MVSGELSEMELDPRVFELAAFARSAPRHRPPTGGSGADADSPRRMPAEEFVAHMTTIMMGAVNGTAELIGIQIDPDLPLHDAVRRQEPVRLLTGTPRPLERRRLTTAEDGIRYRRSQERR